MSALKSAFVYRGIRVRPWMLQIPFILKAVLVVPFVAALGYVGYLHYQEFLNLNYVLIAIFVLALVGIIFLVIALDKYFEERFLFYKKWKRLYDTAFFLKENNYYYTKKKTGQTSKESMKFPKVYLKQGRYELLLYLQMQGNKFQDRFLKLGGSLERTYFMDYMERVDEEKFVAYKMAYSAFLNRIHAREVEYVPDKGVKLSKSFYWNFIEQPHLLIAGGTGGGKTVFVRSLLVALLKIGVVQGCDPKRADFVPLAELDVLKDRIFYEREDIVAAFVNAVQIMNNRFDYMRQLMKECGEKEMGSYANYGLEPFFLVCDEFNAFKSSIDGMGDYKLLEAFNQADIQLILKGRQAGVFLIKLMQKPSSDDLPTKIRSNMMMHISVGKLDDTGYQMMFGDENRDKDFKNITRLGGKKVYGRGYAAEFGNQAQEFYSPLITKDFNFYDVYEQYPRIKNPFDPRESSENQSDESIVLSDLTSEIKQPLKRSEVAEILVETYPFVTESTVRTIYELLKEFQYPFQLFGGVESVYEDDLEMFKQVLAEKASSNCTYKEIIEGLQKVDYD